MFSLSAKMISRRIIMMDKARSLHRQKLLFFLLLPAAVILLMSFSYFENRGGDFVYKKRIGIRKVPHFKVSRIKVQVPPRTTKNSI